jgi:Fic family protein
MGKKLSASNPHLRDPVERERAVLQSVASSSAIEGIHAPFRQLLSSTLKRRQVLKATVGQKTRITG